ncbi:hypothetical protein DICVIV_01197 [Dictyocaulus viviparus]|uniref:Uncharacterized protein n=1 Tax=Dictyocaulus viviparus TaxID=29172 RepID=A0A0D8Y8R8_DICVI|nr:hypothetical protein DICVIV_01197 [Dictyocaulus viviparus]
MLYRCHSVKSVKKISFFYQLFKNVMWGVRRPSLVRQMAFRQDSKDTDMTVRHGYLAPPTVPPDSPRPQKDTKNDILGSTTMITMKVPDTRKENIKHLESIHLDEKRK